MFFIDFIHSCAIPVTAVVSLTLLILRLIRVQCPTLLRTEYVHCQSRDVFVRSSVVSTVALLVSFTITTLVSFCFMITCVFLRTSMVHSDNYTSLVLHNCKRHGWTNSFVRRTRKQIRSWFESTQLETQMVSNVVSLHCNLFNLKLIE